MNTFTLIVIILVIVWAVGARVKQTLNKVFDVTDELLDGCTDHVSVWRETATKTSQLNKLDKEAEYRKRIERINKSRPQDEQIDMDKIGF